MRKIVAIALAGAAASAALTTPAVAAGNDPMCSPGRTKLTWSSKSKPWLVTHKRVVEHYTGDSGKRTYKAEKVAEVKASVKATAGAKVSGKAVLASFEGSIGLELAAEGRITNTKSETVTYNFTKFDTYVFYAGTRKATGYYTQYRCDRGTKWVKTGRYGKAQSWTAAVEGGVRCGTKPPKASLAAFVKKEYC
ncbi:hypothetical protein [Streptomyces sp. ITFR-16]|uniref:hypothetical protein n=1 Tax=Streptomyces sp. ITFR-16 TaxID=3075198 RepID=UPI00288BA4BD|nr:hypothetical protein [Streptomyces sp. ITFR-16]WNI22670.1 hypothetical protein RLT58_12350 [Streptomyces sp. ITFR-16]